MMIVVEKKINNLHLTECKMVKLNPLYHSRASKRYLNSLRFSIMFYFLLKEVILMLLLNSQRVTQPNHQTKFP